MWDGEARRLEKMLGRISNCVISTKWLIISEDVLEIKFDKSKLQDSPTSSFTFLIYVD